MLTPLRRVFPQLRWLLLVAGTVDPSGPEHSALQLARAHRDRATATLLLAAMRRGQALVGQVSRLQCSHLSSRRCRCPRQPEMSIRGWLGRGLPHVSYRTPTQVVTLKSPYHLSEIRNVTLLGAPNPIGRVLSYEPSEGACRVSFETTELFRRVCHTGPFDLTPLECLSMLLCVALASHLLVASIRTERRAQSSLRGF